MGSTMFFCLPNICLLRAAVNPQIWLQRGQGQKGSCNLAADGAVKVIGLTVLKLRVLSKFGINLVKSKVHHAEGK